MSLTEFPAYWCEHPDLFAAIAEGANEKERMERVLRWFICTLKGQYTVSLSPNRYPFIRIERRHADSKSVDTK